MYQGWPFQSTGSTHQRDGSRVNNITWARGDSDSTINEQIIGYDKSIQMGSDSDDANSDINRTAKELNGLVQTSVEISKIHEHLYLLLLVCAQNMRIIMQNSRA